MKIQKLIADEDRVSYVLWALAFVGVCVLVGLGKVKPETLEYVLFALLGFAASKKKPETSDEDSH